MIILFTLLFSLTGFSLTEADVKKTVLENFPLIEASILKFKASGEEVRALEGGFDHKLSFKSQNRIEDKYDHGYIESSIERMTPWRGTSLIVGHRQGRGNFPPYDLKYLTSGAGEIFAGLSIPLLRNSSTDDLRTSVAIAEIEKKQAEEEVRLKKNVYVHKALSLFYKWKLEQRKLQIRKSILDLAIERTSMLEKRYKSGDIERIRLTDNDRTIRKRQDEILKAEIDLNKVRAELSLYLPSYNLLELNQPISEESKSQVQTPQFNPSNLPQIRIADFEVKKLKLEEVNYDQARLPGLGVDVLGARELSANYPNDSERLVVGLKFDYPLENRKAQGRTVAYSYKVQAAQKQQTYLQLELQRYYDFSKKNAETSLSRWEVVSQEFENTLKMAQAEKSKWQQGSSDLFIVNLREQDVADADIKRWTTLYEFKQYELDTSLFSSNFAL